MFVEIFRLIIVIASTAGGYQLADSRVASDSHWVAIGALIGACIGYVAGGVFGRTVLTGFTTLERRVARAPAGEVLVGGLGAAIGVVVAVAFSLPLYFVLPWFWTYPITTLSTLVLGTLLFRLGKSRSDALLALAGLSTRPLVRASPYGGDEIDAHLVDTSAAIDGRLLEVVRAGFVRGGLLIAPFVLDELQGIADQGDPARRRRGKRGLEALEALRREQRVKLHVLDDEVPELQDVDAKLVSLAKRLRVDIVTTDHNLQRVAEVQGVTVLNLNRLADVARPAYVPGETLRITLERAGQQARQAVGFLEDGSMVVVEAADHLLGSDVEVRVNTVHQTAVGRMLFAALTSDPAGARQPV